MVNAESEASRLNAKATTLFKEGKFVEAGVLYEAANTADTLNSPIYLANFALVQLKLKNPALAEVTATSALRRDPRYVKARYRRALARHRIGLIVAALVDLANVLTETPTDMAAIAAFARVSRDLEAQGPNRDFLTPASILAADHPSAYGSATVPRTGEVPVRNSANAPRKPGLVIPDVSSRIPKELRAGTCASCKTVKYLRETEIKTCRGCNTAVYCNAVCQRNHWPIHKKDCIPYDDDNVLAMHLVKNLFDHKFLHLNILNYAMRAIGALHHSLPVPYTAVLLLFVKLVPFPPSTRRRLSITNIVTAPLAVLDKDMRDSYFTQREQMRKTCQMPDAEGIAMLVTPVLAKQKARTMIFVQRLGPDQVLMARQKVVPVGLESHSFWTSRQVTTDLDALYWILEDELANDVDNYSRLQNSVRV